MIITIRSGNDLDPFGGGIERYGNSTINTIHKTERTRMINNLLIIGKWGTCYTYIQEIIEEIVIIANEMGLLDQIELERYDKGDPTNKIVHYSGQELYNAIIKFDMSVI